MRRSHIGIVFQFFNLLEGTSVLDNVALPAIEKALHASFSDLQWVVDAYALGLATCVLTGLRFAGARGSCRVRPPAL
jgi:predicted ABC-type transport system involved in lysophospholipase L1 biosynthesis ATPase subunit